MARSARAFVVTSRLLGEEREIDVAVPRSHAATDRAYPLLLLFDSESIFASVATAAEVLADAGHAPECVVVGVRNSDRLRDLSPPGLPVSGNAGTGRADVFLRFLEEELIPVLRREFRAAGPVTLVGHSTGGLFVHYAAMEDPSTFATVLALDAPMHLDRDSFAQRFIDAASTTAHELRLANLEVLFGWTDRAWDSLAAAAPAGWTLLRAPVEGETHESMVWPASYEGLKALFRWYSAATAADLPPWRGSDGSTHSRERPTPFHRPSPFCGRSFRIKSSGSTWTLRRPPSTA